MDGSSPWACCSKASGWRLDGRFGDRTLSLLAALAIGLVIGLLQTVTQLHDQTLAFVPKLIGVSFVVLYLLPWGLSRMTEYATDLIREIPHRL